MVSRYVPYGTNSKSASPGIQLHAHAPPSHVQMAMVTQESSAHHALSHNHVIKQQMQTQGSSAIVHSQPHQLQHQHLKTSIPNAYQVMMQGGPPLNKISSHNLKLPTKTVSSTSCANITTNNPPQVNYRLPHSCEIMKSNGVFSY